jgi:hypothetical protein
MANALGTGVLISGTLPPIKKNASLFKLTIEIFSQQMA